MSIIDIIGSLACQLTLEVQFLVNTKLAAYATHDDGILAELRAT